MFSRLKARFVAWFVSIVSIETKRAMNRFEADFKGLLSIHIADTFKSEEQALLKRVDGVAASLKQEIILLKAAEAGVFEDEVQRTFEALEARMKSSMEAELDAFKRKITLTWEETIKDEPSHWKAEPDAVAEANALRKVK